MDNSLEFKRMKKLEHKLKRDSDQNNYSLPLPDI
jgi:hypothetical protein